MSRSVYQSRIQAILAGRGLRNPDPRHIEAWMRAENGTLDGLSPGAFEEETLLAIEACEQAEMEISESLAQSYGL